MQVELNALLVCSFFLFLTPFPDCDESMEKKVQTLLCFCLMCQEQCNVMRLGCNQKRNLGVVVVCCPFIVGSSFLS